jgi:hypothetical protein
VGALRGNGKRHGVAHRSVVRRHDDDLRREEVVFMPIDYFERWFG